ncbi:MAG TPA: phosphoribosylglycinamide formyltransferase [Gammaproteobacteria bacterium]|nr:phosphoribosylglycinamide formyltransferase [Gammaproteobacteria bacterium]
MSDARPVVILISGNGSNLQAIIDATHEQGLPLDLRLVVSNRPEAHGLERARAAGIPAVVIDHHDHPDRAAFDHALMAAIDEHGGPEALVVLAGFMRILTDDFVHHYLGRLVNIHPSLLPKYKGLNTHARVLAAGDSETGATVHFVTPALDDGPLILQARVPVKAGDTPETLAARVHEVEHLLYPRALTLIAQGTVQMDTENMLTLWNGQPASPDQLQLALHRA